ncbi:hypothetical protein DdX_22151 [Ditylenchus destructor]|uniref:HAT C-terminal dimerisation domain-containing protein n=1 Tax=Ditylenchus destructor TaxID=166010 RepID=A0AAD4QSN8_9BILA|nr:hypothetical protein DdX_22151 [Ditylenchus destructor]
MEQNFIRLTQELFIAKLVKRRSKATNFSFEATHDGSKHVTNAHRFLGNSATRQMFLQPEPSDPFAADLSYALISANIPLYKVNHPDFRGIGMNPDVIAAYKYAQIQSCDVERSFSIYKRILEDRRTSLTEENIEKLMICNCLLYRVKGIVCVTSE